LIRLFNYYLLYGKDEMTNQSEKELIQQRN